MAGDGQLRCGGERGAVTAELAVLLPAVVALLLAIAGVAVVGSAQVRAQQAAGVLAREEARGGEEASLARIAGDGAQASTSKDGAWSTVTVRRTVPLWSFMGPGIQVEGTAAARAEVEAP